MTRSEAVRQEVLRRDNARCQICGKDEGLNTHHIRLLGMGGSEEKDVTENMITLCAECHGKVHGGQLHIEEFTPDKLVVMDEESRRVPDNQLWFYRRQDAEMLEKEINLIRQVQMTESKHAEILAHIWENYSLLSDAASPEQFVAGLGLDSNRAKDEARAAWWIKGMNLQWPSGVNVRKVLLIASIAILERKTAQDLLDQACDCSYSDLHKALIEKGLKSATMRWYLIYGQYRRPLGRVQTDVLFVRSRDYEEVLNRVEKNVKVSEINAFRYNLKWDRKRQALLDNEGREIPFETWEEEA